MEKDAKKGKFTYEEVKDMTDEDYKTLCADDQKEVLKTLLKEIKRIRRCYILNKIKDVALNVVIAGGFIMDGWLLHKLFTIIKK